MPSTTGKSVMSALVPQLKAGHQQRKGTEVKQDTGNRLPPGIMGGIAQLKEVRIAPIKEGDNAGKVGASEADPQASILSRLTSGIIGVPMWQVIMACLGHKTEKMALYYTRLALQGELAAQGAAIMDRVFAERQAQRKAMARKQIKLVSDRTE